MTPFCNGFFPHAVLVLCLRTRRASSGARSFNVGPRPSSALFRPLSFSLSFSLSLSLSLFLSLCVSCFPALSVVVLPWGPPRLREASTPPLPSPRLSLSLARALTALAHGPNPLPALTRSLPSLALSSPLPALARPLARAPSRAVFSSWRLCR